MSKNVAVSGSQAIAAQRESMTERLQGLGGGGSVDRIATKNRSFVFPDGEIYPKELFCIILDWGLYNAFYPPNKPYTPGSKDLPDCFAVGAKPADMVPSENSPDIQNDGNPCATCWANQFGSGVGNGKACKNYINIAVLTYDEGSEGDIYLVRVSPSANAAYKEYVEKLASKGLAPVQAVTRLGFDEKVTYDKLTFTADAAASKDEEFQADIEACAERIPEATEIVMREPKPKSDEE